MIKRMMCVAAACYAVLGMGAVSCHGTTTDLTEVVLLELVWCPPGMFWMGSPSNEVSRSADEMRHRVTLTQGFWIGKYPVTQQQWKAVMGAGNRTLKKWTDLPMENVSWEECQTFLLKLNEKLDTGQCKIENGKVTIKVEKPKRKTEEDKPKNEKDKRDAGLVKSKVFRLPTEAEWEYACRAGSEGSYAGDVVNMGWFDDNSGGKTHPVGQKKANAWGLHDMHGSVWEWCADWYGDYPACDTHDPKGPEMGTLRVLRGGCWYTYARFCRSASRSMGDPSYRYSGLGFRVVRTCLQSNNADGNQNAR